MAHHDELSMLMSTAITALTAAFNEGDRSGYDGKWLEQTPNEHLAHAHDHVDEVAITAHAGSLTSTDSDLDSAIWRLIALKCQLMCKEMGQS